MNGHRAGPEIFAYRLRSPPVAHRRMAIVVLQISLPFMYGAVYSANPWNNLPRANVLPKTRPAQTSIASSCLLKFLEKTNILHVAKMSRAREYHHYILDVACREFRSKHLLLKRSLEPTPEVLDTLLAV